MTIQKVTTAACKAVLPRVLIDYLWQLAAESDASVHTFTLSAKYVGGGEVQDILHKHNNFSSWRRVFGYPPVDAVVEVHISGQGSIMFLRKGGAGPARKNREEEWPCSA